VELLEVDSRLPPALTSIVMQCLSKSPDDRYHRGSELADALLGYLARDNDAGALRAAGVARRTLTNDHR
jgi:hypothetical protein